MKVEESQEGQQKTKKEIEGSKKESRRQVKKYRKRKQRICKERQRRKIESRKQGKQNTGKERLKRIVSEKTKIKKCMFHLENRQQQRKEGRKQWNWGLHNNLCWGDILKRSQ